MKIKQILVAFLFATLVISCGNKAKDIDVSELKTECDVTDASLIVMDEVIALGEAVDSEEGASEEQKKEYESLRAKMQEIMKQASKLDLDKDKYEDCPNYETAKKKGKKTRKVNNELQKAMK